ncbi:CoA transferase [Actinomadura sp. LD22]|uniref:CoA transferase n=1 Tax=Actinomadura physcomitrii TaxID=2650748 RepID=A0A6I4M722_9ACTN|nr:CoA transferase [Actinomadura physcomitrii]MWA01583.1 CoA transferase [Actinomadura physcomitrii]
MSSAAPGRPGRALEGMVVLDLGQIYNGPYCTMLLRQLGAEVIKIEPGGGEPIRWRGDGTTVSQAFNLLNGGKQGLELNLKSAAGVELFLRLVAVADVVVENFAPGVMERLGLGYDRLEEANPRLVLASGKGFDSASRHKDLRAMDITVQAISGMMAATGFEGQPPVKSGGAVADFIAGTHLAAAILGALVQRERTGRGQRVEVNMYDAILPTLTSNIAGYLDSGGTAPERVGNRHGGLSVAPYNVYASADGWIAVLCMRDRHWQTLCRLVGREDLLADESLATPRGRVEAIGRVDEVVSAWIATLTTAGALKLLQEGDIPAAPVRRLREVIEDPDVRERGMLVEVDDHGRPGYAYGSPLRLGASAPVAPAQAPDIGEHNGAVLSRLLGLTEAEIEECRRRGAW